MIFILRGEHMIMNTNELLLKFSDSCQMLGASKITAHQFVTELTYLLFLKMVDEKELESYLPEKYSWASLVRKQGVELKHYYNELLTNLGENYSSVTRQIYVGSHSSIAEPKNLEKMIRCIDALDWYEAKTEGLAITFEKLLDKVVAENKNAADFFFTPKRLVDLMVTLLAPQPGERCNDPVCGTFDYMIAADQFVKAQTDNNFMLPLEAQEFQICQAFTGCEAIHESQRLGLMNAFLHDLEGEITLGDVMSSQGQKLNNYDLILTNLVFEAKRKMELTTRKDLTYPTKERALNILQHIYRSLKADGKARAGVILADAVLANEAEGIAIRHDLMNKCDLQQVLFLPAGLFGAKDQGSSVLFFTRGQTEKNNTKEVWFYDLHTGINPGEKAFESKHFNAVKKAFMAKNRHKIKDVRFFYRSRNVLRNNHERLDYHSINR